MGDAVLSNAEERIVMKNSSVEADDRRETTKLIPTAIVKPKYQKLSFDERQLPVCGAIETEESWKATNDTTTITTTPRKVQKHLPKNQKSFTKQNRNMKSDSDFNVTDKIAINRGECDIECRDGDGFHQSSPQNNNNNNNSVAIVQPIKKVIDLKIDEQISGIAKKEIDGSINSESMNGGKKTDSVRGKISQTNERKVAGMSDCGGVDKFIKNGNRKFVECEKVEDKKVPTNASKKLQKIHSGK
jgi:hypothetical protein